MKTLKPGLYKNIASVLASNDESFRSATNIILFTRVLQIYPCKNKWYQACHRLIHYLEMNIRSISLIIETMIDEGEDKEIIDAIELIRKEPTITTTQELSQLCTLLNDYVKWSKLLQAKDSFIKCLDMLEDDDAPLHETVESLYQLSGGIQIAYNSVNMNSSVNRFDSTDPDGMKTAIAQAKDLRAVNRVIITGERGLNNLLSPGYVSGGVYVYMALPGCYKSGTLLDGHVSACMYNGHIKETLNGKTPISMYISMENTMAQTIRRLWSLLYPNADMSMFTVDEICDMINQKMESQGFRSIILYYGYREKSTADLANIIRAFNTETTHVVCVFLDYIKRIRPARTDIAATQSEKTELHAIMNELKAIAANFEIPIITAHQLNRAAAQAVDAIKRGGVGATAEGLTRSGTSSAWEIMEVADVAIDQNIEMDGDNKWLIYKAVKQRDLDSNSDNSVKAIAHPFTSPNSFLLVHDILETCSVSVPLYSGTRTTNFVAANI